MGIIQKHARFMVVTLCTYTVKEFSSSAEIEAEVQVIRSLRKERQSTFATSTQQSAHLEVIVKCDYVWVSTGDFLQHCNLVSDLTSKWRREKEGNIRKLG